MAGRRLTSVAVGLRMSSVTPSIPDRFHPVARFGTAMSRVEERLWADRPGPGALYAAIGVAMGTAAGVLVRSPAVGVVITTAGGQLRHVAEEIARLLEDGELDGARQALRALVGRDVTQLDESGIAAAVIESVAENMVDAVFSPVLWASAAGAPGATAFRAVNTMDAMVGHRGPRYGRFGTAAARLDDAANLAPARIFALVLSLAAGRNPLDVRRAALADARSHPSPNAGVAEATMAVVLGRELGGPLRYGSEVEQRPTLGSGPRPDRSDIARAVALAARSEDLLATSAALGGAVAAAVASRTRRRRHQAIEARP